MKISILIEISILIKISILKKPSILIKPSNVVCFLPLPHHHPFVDFGILSLEYQKEIWPIDEEINLIQKGKVRCITKLSCGLVVRRKTWQSSQSIPLTHHPQTHHTHKTHPEPTRREYFSTL